MWPPINEVYVAIPKHIDVMWLQIKVYVAIPKHIDVM
jgi:hypothetical protein